MACSPTTLWQIDGETMETVRDLKKKTKKLFKCIHLIVFQNIYVLLYNKYFQTKKKKKKSDVAVSQTEMARYLR